MVTASKDITHLLSEEARARRPSPLKTAFKYFGNPDIVFLGGGLPLSDYFPWNKVTAHSPAVPFSKGIGAVPVTEEDALVIDLHKKKEFLENADDIELSRALQYGYTEGQHELMKFLKEHTELIHKLPYEDWGCVATIGNTQAWDAVLRTFCDKGDTILVEEFTFSSALETANALGITQFPVPMDESGILPDKLEHLLDNWVGKKPKLLYIIPTGQNPTGSCLSVERRKAIYKVAQKHDFVIIEDEPYYFLQMETYTQDVAAREGKHVHSHEEFINALVTSFLHLDTEGRVIRLDSFSKVLAPGTRFGWIVAQNNILERFVRLHEVTIQCPSGFTQSIINGTLQRWGQSGYLDWLIGLRAEYTHKRDVAIDAVYKNFPLDVIKFTPPVAGMFFTISFDASKHPDFETKYGKDPLKVEEALYESGLQGGCLMIPGSWFKAVGQTEPPQPVEETDPESANWIFFRGTYAAVPLDKLQKGLENFGASAKKEYGL